jgi:arsenical pump membrane protein
VTEALALIALAATLAAAVARPRWAPDWAVAAAAAVLLVVIGALSVDDAADALGDLGPTVAFLVALLVLADGCRRAGLFDALGAAMAGGSRGSSRRLLAMVFLAAAATTAALSLDATVVLLTPVVFATAARLRVDPRPHVYACSHLANSGSLLLPVSNLTNLLAFQASGLSFARFAALMVLPWLAALAVEWVVLSRAFAGELKRPRRAAPRPSDTAPRGRNLPAFPLFVLGATLAGFALSSLAGIEPVWVAAAGAVVLAVRERPAPGELLRAAEPAFLVFVLGLGVVRARGERPWARVGGRRAAPTRRRPGGPAHHRRRQCARREPRQQPAGDADRPAGRCGERAGCGARDADRRQRRPEPDLRRLARHAAVAAGPARARHRRRPR